MRPASSSAEYSPPASNVPAARPRAAWNIRANLLNIAAALTVVIIVAITLKELRAVLQPLFIAVFLLYLAQPLVSILNRRGVPSTAAHLIVFAVFVTLLVLFAGLLVERIDNLARELPRFQEKLRDAGTATASGIAEDLPFIRRHLRAFASRVDIMKPIAGAVTGFMGSLMAFASGTVLVIFYFVFLVREQRTLPDRLDRIYGKDKAARIREVGQRINGSIARYMYVKFLASIFTAGAALAAMLVFRLDLAVPWATVLFLLNFIPYVGSILAFAFPLAVAVLQYSTVWPVVALGGIFLAIDMFVGNYWEPRVAGQRLNLSPLVVVFALAFWGWIWGTVGMILAVPITVSLRFVLENISYTRPLAVLISDRAPKGSES